MLITVPNSDKSRNKLENCKGKGRPKTTYDLYILAHIMYKSCDI